MIVLITLISLLSLNAASALRKGSEYIPGNYEMRQSPDYTLHELLKFTDVLTSEGKLTNKPPYFTVNITEYSTNGYDFEVVIGGTGFNNVYYMSLENGKEVEHIFVTGVRTTVKMSVDKNSIKLTRNFSNDHSVTTDIKFSKDGMEATIFAFSKYMFTVKFVRVK